MSAKLETRSLLLSPMAGRHLSPPHGPMAEAGAAKALLAPSDLQPRPLLADHLVAPQVAPNLGLSPDVENLRHMTGTHRAEEQALRFQLGAHAPSLQPERSGRQHVRGGWSLGQPPMEARAEEVTVQPPGVVRPNRDRTLTRGGFPLYSQAYLPVGRYSSSKIRPGK